MSQILPFGTCIGFLHVLVFINLKKIIGLARHGYYLIRGANADHNPFQGSTLTPIQAKMESIALDYCRVTI